jgi:hypothetical protein
VEDGVGAGEIGLMPACIIPNTGSLQPCPPGHANMNSTHPSPSITEVSSTPYPSGQPMLSPRSWPFPNATQNKPHHRGLLFAPYKEQGRDVSTPTCRASL